MNLFKKISLFLFVLISSCAIYQEASRGPSSIGRISYEYAKENKIRCQKSSKKACFNLYPYTTLKRKWNEVFAYQFLNRRNIVQNKYLSCQVDASILCAEKFGFEVEVEKLRKMRDSFEIEKAIETSKKNTFFNHVRNQFDWNSDEFIFKQLKLSARDIRRLFVDIRSLYDIFNKMLSSLKEVNQKVSRKALSLFNGVGIGFNPKAGAAVGIQANFEAIIHNGKLGLFCAPGVQLETDIGVSANINFIKTIGCKSNQDYAGKFFSVSAGLSGETLGIPVSIGGSYSIALGLKELLDELARAKENETFSPYDFFRELDELAAISSDKLIQIFGSKKLASRAVVTFKVMAKLAGDESVESYELLGQRLKEIEKEHTERVDYKKLMPIGPMMQKIAAELRKWVEESGPELSNSLVFLDILERNLNSCDAMAGQVGASFTLSPVSVGASVYEYVEVGEIDLKDLFYLVNFNLPNLITGKVDKVELKKLNGVLKRTFSNLPTREKFSVCSTRAYESFSKELRDLRTIFSTK